MNSVKEDIDLLVKESESKLADANKLKRLLDAYPDLETKTIRKYGKVYYSASINSKADKSVLRHSCGCCNDAPLEVMPYIETPDGRVYSNPPSFIVGEQNALYYSDVPNKGWSETLKKANIPDSIIMSVAAHFKKEADEIKESIEETFKEAQEIQNLIGDNG